MFISEVQKKVTMSCMNMHSHESEKLRFPEAIFTLACNIARCGL